MDRLLVRLALFAALILMPSVAWAQAWAGIIASSRATDWSGVGATITNRTTLCANLSISATVAQVQSAINSCAPGGVVQLASGTYTFSQGIMLSTSNITLRGAGAGATTLRISGINPSGCHIGLNTVIRMCTGVNNGIGVDSPENTATWTAGYSQGTTQITLSNSVGITAGALGTGTTLWLDQNDDATDGFPAAGDTWNCSDPAGSCANQPTTYFARSGRGQVEGFTVTACSPSCGLSTSTTVTISPGLRMPNWRASQSPGAWWNNSGTVLKNTGLEDLTIDFSPAGGTSGVGMINCTNCWVKGVRLIVNNTAAPTELYHVFTINTLNPTFRDMYLWGPAQQANAQYNFGLHLFSSGLIQNNILHHNVSPIVPNSAVYGSVIGYNYIDDSYYSGPGLIAHGRSGMNLYEGNNAANASADIIHSAHLFWTWFRNHHDALAHNPQNIEDNAAAVIKARSRFFNLIGNVFGHSRWTQYQASQVQLCQNCIYEFGSQGTSSPVVPSDANVIRTVMRWGNWDNVTSTNNTSTSDSTGSRFVSAEVPSGISAFPNPVPASNSLPASFYLAGVPSDWWSTTFGTPPFPPIGPDVVNGNAPNTVTVPTGGHANKIPARLCFENIPVDPAYPTTSPRVRLFTASLCYTTTGASLPAAPSNLTVTQ